MNKYEAQQAYWSRFGIPAYNELTVPETERDRYPYITYQKVNGSLDGQVTASANIYYRSTSWREIDEKITEMEPLINHQIEIEGGYLKVRKPEANFAQQMSDPDPAVRRYTLTVEVEFLTRH